MTRHFAYVRAAKRTSRTHWMVATLLCTAVLAIWGRPALAQAYPSQPITIIVPFAAGGPTDTVGRKLAAELTSTLGQPVNVVNHGGLGGTIGAKKAADASPDGYTLLLHHIGMATAPALYRNLSFDPQKDFEPIGLIVDAPMLLLSAPKLPIGDGKKFAAFVKANQATLSMAYAGIGSASHLCGLLMASVLKLDLFSVPYTGTSLALADLERGRADVLCDQTTSALKAVRAGTVSSYAITSPKRLESMPDIPTTQEIGLSGLQVSIWHALYAPRNTPQQVIEAVSRALQLAVTSPSFVSAMLQVGAIPVAPRAATPQALRTHLAEQTAKWKPLILKSAQFAD